MLKEGFYPPVFKLITFIAWFYTQLFYTDINLLLLNPFLYVDYTVLNAIEHTIN